MLLVIVGGLGGCFVSPVHRFGSGKSRQQVVHEQAAQLTPSGVRAVGAWSGEVQTKKVRVWADDEYRAQHVRWQQSFDEILEDANPILAAQFGVKLTPEYVSWSYRAPAAATLEETLGVLAAHDPGKDAFVVIGLTSSLSLVTTTFDAIGMAFTPGRHLLIRGYSDLKEREALEIGFRDLTKQERDVMYESRKHHKRLSLLLHELGHTFGAQHVTDPTSLMTPSYSVQAASFDAANRTQITSTLDTRLGRSQLTAASTTPVKEPAQPAEKPKPVERAPLKLDPADTTPVIEIVIDAEGQRRIGGKLQADAMLDGAFLLAYDKHKRTRVYVRTSTSTPPAIANDVVARAKRAGLQRVIVTEE